MIEIRGLTKKYNKLTALDGIDLDIGKGEIIGLLGENGAGKTTLMKCMLNLTDYSGSILLDGEPVTRKNISRMSFATTEKSFFAGLTAAEHRDFYRMNFGTFREKRFDGLLDFFELPKNRPIRTLSMGQQNQFEVIAALSQGAEYILMDEPFAGNDVFNREDFYKVLMGILEPDETIILSTHLIEEISGFVGRAVLIHKGKIIGDSTADDLDSRGLSLMDYVKQKYGYREDRVARALSDITGEAEGDEN